MVEMDNVCDPARLLLSRVNDSHQALRHWETVITGYTNGSGRLNTIDIDHGLTIHIMPMGHGEHLFSVFQRLTSETTFEDAGPFYVLGNDRWYIVLWPESPTCSVIVMIHLA
ncbi:hypothetical protein FOXB_13302 [Fusarium oxysporum f. sp. conglutinans Fo5176]|uniref:Uncharacterized protein n=1 Tax=Fusarium oxysporum (strain Fo5176) TaxID=660025 RepID=F9G3S0_FUSOF|nr:hypothetical protein FOXB_13302 [Fusarium oxysporum f. sp. conglutinans Fo5176]